MASYFGITPATTTAGSNFSPGGGAVAIAIPKVGQVWPRGSKTAAG